jgi:hypothetical protein
MLEKGVKKTKQQEDETGVNEGFIIQNKFK